MMSIDEIVGVTNASVTGSVFGSINVRNILTDSRQLQIANETLFVALRTAKNDGHKYIPALYAKGVRLFLVEHGSALGDFSDAVFIKVENTLTALQQIAAAHRKLFNIPVLAITGSNGKTIVKEWISSMLRVDKKVVSSPKSYNSQIGVPLSVWQMKESDEFAVFEAGISQPNEMSALQKIINPTIGIFTNVGTAHDEYFANGAQKTAEKLKLFTNVSLLIYCADYPQIREQLQLSLPSLKTLSWAMGKDVEADVKILSVDVRSGISLVTADFGEQTIFGSYQLKVELPFTDSASIENAIHCWIFMLSQGYENAEISKRIKRLQPIEMRMEMKEGINHCFIINDFYNSDYNSFLIALDFLSNQHQNKFRRIILSDILQSGRSDKDLYQDVASALQKKGIDAIIGIGEDISKQRAAFAELQSSEFFSDTESFLRQAKTENFNNETILLKGARTFGFERISRFFQKKVHQTVFEINIDAIVHNLNVFRS
ncbi:MAG: Mur ligase domain-containing protein, partial [Bacteroidales bacterium]|nr:Mur ligase domain-containing protein [Bacteroidales bacterium]